MEKYYTGSCDDTQALLAFLNEVQTFIESLQQGASV